MIIWIAGHTGFLGSSLAQYITTKFKNAKIIGVDRYLKCQIISHESFLHFDTKKIRSYSISDAILKYGSPNYLFITSGSPTVALAEKDIVSSIDANVTFLNRLLDASLNFNSFTI